VDLEVAAATMAPREMVAQPTQALPLTTAVMVPQEMLVYPVAEVPLQGQVPMEIMHQDLLVEQPRPAVVKVRMD
jgi:hypothetical protein